MPLRTEFLEETLEEEEVKAFLSETRFRLRETIKRQPSGRLGVFIGWASLPSYLDQAPKFPEEWCAMYYFTDKLYEYELEQGIYKYGEVTIVVQLEKDHDLRKLYHEVEVKGASLKRVSEAFGMLCAGKLKPFVPYASSSGTIEAPKEEGSGQLSLCLPPMAATETEAA
ncbi:MAG: hypothetical protein NUW08_02420 [Candidatus Uhrbacteria bacterium]|nr:hypothetical protein [Candidatus Uhrbacteria bacterium]